MAALFERNLSEDRRADLAARLGLPVECLARMSGLGWDDAAGCWTFPERNGLGSVVGVLQRYPDGAKRAMTGSARGLALVGGWIDEPGPVYVVEGPTDTLALAAVGLAPVGRPSDTGGVADLLDLFREVPPHRPILVVGENDRKPDTGLWPGRDAAKGVAEQLAHGLNREVGWALPPEQYKDVREWVLDRIGGAGEGFDLAAVGTDIGHELSRATVTVRSQPGGAPAHSAGGRLVTPRKYPLPVPVTDFELPGAGGVRWVWDGFLARDAVTLLSALPKCGKTTLLTHLLAALPAGGSFCGRPLAAGRAVVVSEEPKGVWAARREAVGLGRDIRVIPRGMWGKPGNADDWAGFLAHLGDHLAGDPADLLVFDTLANLWPVRDENSAAEVGAALAPLHRLVGGRAVLLVHHLRKSDGGEGTGSRGSGALAGFVDVIAELRRAKTSADVKGTRRVLTGYGRYDGIPSEWVVELVEGEPGSPGASAPGGGGRYVHRPEKEDGAKDGGRGSELRRAILGVLEVGGPKLSRKEIWDRLPAGVRVNEVRFKSVLEAEAGKLWRKEGSQAKGEAFRYYRVVDGDHLGFNAKPVPAPADGDLFPGGRGLPD